MDNQATGPKKAHPNYKGNCQWLLRAWVNLGGPGRPFASAGRTRIPYRVLGLARLRLAVALGATGRSPKRSRLLVSLYCLPEATLTCLGASTAMPCLVPERIWAGSLL